MANKEADDLNNAPPDESTQKILEYYQKYSQNKELRKYFSGSPAEYIPRIEITEADEEPIEERSPSRASSVMSRKLEWDNMADIGYENSHKMKKSSGSLQKSSSLPILSNRSDGDSKSSDLLILIKDSSNGESSDSSRSVSSSENRVRTFASTLQYLKQKIGNPDAHSTPKFPEEDLKKPEIKGEKSRKQKRPRNVVSLENIHINTPKTAQSDDVKSDEVKEFQKPSTVNLHVTKPVTIECLDVNIARTDSNSQTETVQVSKSIQTDKMSKSNSSSNSKSSESIPRDPEKESDREFEVHIEETKETNEQYIYFTQQESNSNSNPSTTSQSTRSSSVTSKCNSFEFKKAYTPSSEKESSQIEENYPAKASSLRRSQRQSDLSHFKSKGYDADCETQILLDSIISMSQSEAFNKSNAEIDKNLHLLEKLVKSKRYDEKTKKLYLKKIVKKICNSLQLEEFSEKSSSSSDLFRPKKSTQRKDEGGHSQAGNDDKSEDEIIPVDARQAGKKLTRFTLTNNEFSVNHDSVMQTSSKLSHNRGVTSNNPDSNESTLPSSNSNLNSGDSNLKSKIYDNWKEDKTLSEQLLEKNGDLLVHFAKKERQNQLQWISNEISHLNKLKSLLQKDLSSSDGSTSSKKSKMIKKTTTYTINNNQNKGEAKNFVIETELPAHIDRNEEIEFKIGSNRYTVKELSETDDIRSKTSQKQSRGSEKGEGDGNRLVNEILINEQEDGTTKLKINTICKVCSQVPCICVDKSYKNVVCFCNNVNCLCKSASSPPVCRNCPTPVCNCGIDKQQQQKTCVVCMNFPCICYDYSQTFQFVPKTPAIRPATFPRSGSSCPCGRRFCNCDLIKRIEDFCNENMKTDDKKSERTQTQQKRKPSQIARNSKTQTCKCNCSCHPVSSSGTSSSTTTKSSSNKKVMTSLKTRSSFPPPSSTISSNVNESANISNQAAVQSVAQRDDTKTKNQNGGIAESDETKSSTTTCACCNRSDVNGEMAILVSEHRYPLCLDCLEKNPGVTTVCYDKDEHVCTCFTAVNSKKLKSHGDALTISDTDLVHVEKSTDHSSDLESSSIASECTCYDYNNSVIISKDKNKNVCRYCRKKLMATAKTGHGIAYTLTIENDRNLNVRKPKKQKHLEEIKLKVPHPYGLDKKSSQHKQSKKKLLEIDRNLGQSDSKSSVTKTLEIRESNLGSEYQSDKLSLPKSSSEKMKDSIPNFSDSKPSTKTSDTNIRYEDAKIRDNKDLSKPISSIGNKIQEKSDSYKDLKPVESSAESSNMTTINTEFSSNGKSDRDFEERELRSQPIESESPPLDEKIESDKQIEGFDLDKSVEKLKEGVKFQPIDQIICKDCKCQCKHILEDYLKQLKDVDERDLTQHEIALKARRILDERSRSKERKGYLQSKDSKDLKAKPEMLSSKDEVDSQRVDKDNVKGDINQIITSSDREVNPKTLDSKYSKFLKISQEQKTDYKLSDDIQRPTKESDIKKTSEKDKSDQLTGKSNYFKDTNLDQFNKDEMFPTTSKSKTHSNDAIINRKDCNCKCRQKLRDSATKKTSDEKLQSKKGIEHHFESKDSKDLKSKIETVPSKSKFDSQKVDLTKTKRNLDIIIPRMDQDLQSQISDPKLSKILKEQRSDHSQRFTKEKDIINDEKYRQLRQKDDVHPMMKTELKSYEKSQKSNALNDKDNLKDSRSKRIQNDHSAEKFTSTKIQKLEPQSLDNYARNVAQNRPVTANQLESNQRYYNQTKLPKSDKVIQNNFEDNYRSYEKRLLTNGDKYDFPIYTNEIYDFSNKKVQTKFDEGTKSKYQNGRTDYDNEKEIEDSSLRRHLQKNRPKFLKNAETRRAIINACKEKRMRDMEQRRLDFYNLNKDKVETKICQKLFTDREMKEITRKNYEKLPEVRHKLDQQRQRVIKDANKLIMDLFTEKLRCYALKGKRNFPLDSNVINLGNNIYENVKS